MTKHYFSQKYGIPEKDIDESLIPIFIAQEKNETALLNALNKNTERHSEIISKINNSIKPTIYENLDRMSFWKLFVFRWGWTLWLLPILLTLSGIYLYTHKPQEVIPQVLRGVVEEQNGHYYILKENYVIAKDKNGNMVGIEIVK